VAAYLNTKRILPLRVIPNWLAACLYHSPSLDISLV